MKKVTPKSNEYMSDGPIGMTKKKDKKVYPEIRLRHEFIPESKNMEVGKTYEIELKVKVVGLSISKFSNETEVEIHGYELGEGKEEKEEKK